MDLFLVAAIILLSLVSCDVVNSVIVPYKWSSVLMIHTASGAVLINFYHFLRYLRKYSSHLIMHMCNPRV